MILLIGLPGSGKSTLATFFCGISTCRLISTDAIRAHLFGDETIQGAWLKIWLEIRREFHEAVSQIMAGEIEFAIYDATNAVRKQRRQAIALARKIGFTHITGVWVDVPIEICLERNQQRLRRVPEEVILRMARRLYGAPPSLEEGLDRLIQTDSIHRPFSSLW